MRQSCQLAKFIDSIRKRLSVAGIHCMVLGLGLYEEHRRRVWNVRTRRKRDLGAISTTLFRYQWSLYKRRIATRRVMEMRLWFTILFSTSLARWNLMWIWMFQLDSLPTIVDITTSAEAYNVFWPQHHRYADTNNNYCWAAPIRNHLAQCLFYKVAPLTNYVIWRMWSYLTTKNCASALQYGKYK